MRKSLFYTYLVLALAASVGLIASCSSTSSDQQSTAGDPSSVPSPADTQASQVDSSATALDSCAGRNCGTVNGVVCGTCSGDEYCYENATCVKPCARVQCGTDHGVTCPPCPDKNYCDTGVGDGGGTCLNACAGMNCGTDHGVSCGTCSPGQPGEIIACLPGRNVCRAVCYHAQCGQDQGVNCGTCPSDSFCDTVNLQCISTSPDMVIVPAGDLTLGSANSSNNPAHPVSMRQYQIDINEVTAGDYAKCVAARKCTAVDSSGTMGGTCNVGVAGRESHPANCVTWGQAWDYCGWVGKSLPNEETWEYAARYDDDRLFSWGSAASTAALANFDSGSTEPVGSHRSGGSKLGIQDLSGNVWELTASCYCNSPPCGSIPCPDNTTTAYMSIRGGSYGDTPVTLDFRHYFSRYTSRSATVGFRCAK